MAPVGAPPQPPQWLKNFIEWLEHALAPVGRLFGWINRLLPDAPYARIFFWGMIAILAVVLLWIVVDRFRNGVWRMPRLRRARVAEGTQWAQEDDWTPDAAPARAWLDQADALAAQGHYAQAVHHLLLRSVEDLSRRRPQIVRPALTSRDLARAEGIPSAPRRLFGEIAATVERSLFGGRPVDADEWQRCRAAYADFAQPKGWAR